MRSFYRSNIYARFRYVVASEESPKSGGSVGEQPPKQIKEVVNVRTENKRMPIDLC
jgi:hypothetical protein